MATLETDAETVLDLSHKAKLMNEWFPQRGERKFARMETVVEKTASLDGRDTLFIYANHSLARLFGTYLRAGDAEDWFQMAGDTRRRVSGQWKTGSLPRRQPT